MNATRGQVNKGKTLMGVAEKRVGTAPLCFECGGKGHYDVVCTIKGLHFCIEKLEPEHKADQKEA